MPVLYESVGNAGAEVRPENDEEKEMTYVAPTPPELFAPDSFIKPKNLSRNERRQMTREEIYFNERSRGAPRREARERSRVISHAIAKYVQEESQKAKNVQAS